MSQNTHPKFICNISPFVLKGSRSMKYDLESSMTNVTVSFEMLGSDYPATQRHMPEKGEYSTTPL